jgi:hypothetical protein
VTFFLAFVIGTIKSFGTDLFTEKLFLTAKNLFGFFLASTGDYFSSFTIGARARMAKLFTFVFSTI